MSEDLVAAFDVGGTYVKAALFDRSLVDGPVRPRAVTTRPTVRGADGLATAEAIAGQAVDMLAELTEGTGNPGAAGLVVPGLVDEDAGIVRYSANFGWRDLAFGEVLRNRLGMPVAFGHDTSASGLAEYRLGAARGFGTAVVIPVGTGIAAALLLDGRLHRAGGQAGEIGHLDVGHPSRCRCGATGCLEAIASASAIARRFTERTGRATDAAAVVTAAGRGDPDATLVLTEALDGLAHAVRTLVSVLAPEVVVFGGGLFSAGEAVLEPVRRKVSEGLTFHRVPELRVAELGAEAGCYGAALLALEITR